jgi:spoIIIJ-associated protein
MSETEDKQVNQGIVETAGSREGDGQDQAEGSDKKRRRRRRKPKKSYEPPDEVSARALEFVTEVVAEMKMNCSVQLRPPQNEEDNDVRLEVSGQDARHIIGKKGQTLSALQFLANRAINRPGEDRRYITVDAEGYRSRRDDSLASMAKRLGKQAVTDGKIITFEPMSPRDRRVVHLALSKFEGVITRSEGESDSRRVQIIPVRS